MRAHEVDYEVIGEDMQLVEVELDPGETVIADLDTLGQRVLLALIEADLDAAGISYSKLTGRTRKRDQAIKTNFGCAENIGGATFSAARSQQGSSAIAGYHWFGDWGRDTMIALPGLALVTGRFDIAARILRTFAHFVDRGMLPNRFPDSGETPEYNTVDATLWYFEAIRAYHAATGDDRTPGYDRIDEHAFIT